MGVIETWVEWQVLDAEGGFVAEVSGDDRPDERLLNLLASERPDAPTPFRVQRHTLTCTEWEDA